MAGRESQMDLEIKRFDAPDDSRVFRLGRFELLTIAGSTLGRATTSPAGGGRRTSARSREDLCEIEHLGIVVSGRAAVRMRDGRELMMEPGDVFAIPPGHDSWVIGDEPTSRCT
jgi:ethanolamine utilization protein EutQ (cupin superfamily)